jgi:Fe2+ or Zn2+ uptake regulation protein
MKTDVFVAAMRRSGMRSTPQRIRVIETVLGLGHAPTAAELCAVLSDLPRSSVYRALEALEVAHILESSLIKWQRRYEVAAPYAPHHHIACEVCGRLEAIDDLGIESLLDAMVRKKSFTMQSHKLEIEGTCASCQSGAAEEV